MVSLSFACYFSFTCSAEVSVSLISLVCFAVSYGFALLSAAIARLALTLLSCNARGRLHASNSAVFRLLSAAASFFTLTWLRASWSVGTPRLRHVRKDRQVFTSGGGSLSLLAPFLRVLLSTVHRESSLCLHFSCGLGLLRHTGNPWVFLFVLSASSAPSASARSPGFLTISSMYCT